MARFSNVYNGNENRYVQFTIKIPEGGSMYSLTCDKVPPATDGTKRGICKCYLNRAHSTLHVIGGIYSNTQTTDETQVSVNCRNCSRYHQDVPLLTNMCG